MKRRLKRQVMRQPTTEDAEVIKKVELHDGYSIVVENDQNKAKTMLGVEDWQLIFTSKDDVITFIALLKKGLEFWEYD